MNDAFDNAKMDKATLERAQKELRKTGQRLERMAEAETRAPETAKPWEWVPPAEDSVGECILRESTGRKKYVLRQVRSGLRVLAKTETAMVPITRHEIDTNPLLSQIAANPLLLEALKAVYAYRPVMPIQLTNLVEAALKAAEPKRGGA